MTLEHRLRAPEGAPDGTVAVLLHGRGSDMDDLQGLARLLPPSWTLVTPRAPFPAAPWGYGPGWAWYRYLAEDRLVTETLETSLEVLDRFLDLLPELVGGRVDHLVLGGFSQGGTTSLAYSLRHPERVGTILNLSGFLADGLSIPDARLLPPIYWGHGLHDPAIPHPLAGRGRARLRSAGAPLVAEDFPIGHSIVPQEIEAAVRLVREAARGVEG